MSDAQFSAMICLQAVMSFFAFFFIVPFLYMCSGLDRRLEEHMDALNDKLERSNEYCDKCVCKCEDD